MTKYDRLKQDLELTGYGNMKCFGNSMTPILQNATLNFYIREIEYQVGDIVFCKVKGRYIDSHLITKKGDNGQYLISNNHGHDNGWTSKIYGRVYKTICNNVEKEFNRKNSIMTKENVIDRFNGNYFFLSNFYPLVMIIDGITYKTNEHFYQSKKALNKTDEYNIINCDTAKAAKKIGGNIYCRPDWENVKDDIMLTGLYYKFATPIMHQKLLETDPNILIEGNTWYDTYWGICNGKGLNKLGKLLMKIREEIKNGKF